MASRFHAGSKRQERSALLYYIKSYGAGHPDPARRSVIENVYKKVSSTLDGLDDKIGPGVAAASTTPTPTPL